MLQGIYKQSRYSLLGCLSLFLSALACTSDSASSSKEKASYLADYESPSAKWGFMDMTGKLVVPALYDEVGQFSEHKATVNKAGLWGYIDTLGKIIIRPQFRLAYLFHEYRARVKPFDLPECYITASGKIISAEEWTAAGDFSNHRAMVTNGTHYGYIDTSGTWVIQAQYSRAWNFDYSLARVEIQGKQGIIDINGNYIVLPHYDNLKMAAPYNLILGSMQNNAVLMNLEGKEIDRIDGAIPKETDGKLVALQKDDKMWLYSIVEKKYLQDTGFDQLIYAGNQRWSAKIDGSFHLLDDHGKVVSTAGYAQINKFANGVAAYHRDAFWGYLDTTGKELTKPIFGLAWDYHDGFARAAFKDGLAYVNLKQEIVIYPPAGSIDMRDFQEGRSPVQMIR
jgi:hypothetical protein